MKAPGNAVKAQVKCPEYMDWQQLWETTTLPTPIPIVAMLFMIPFFPCYLRQRWP